MPNIGTIIPLPQDQRIAGFTHIVRLTYADIAQLTSGTAQGIVPNNTLALPTTLTIPAGSVVRRVIARVVTAVAASAGTLTTLTMVVGDGGSTNRYLASVTAMTAAWLTGYAGSYTYTAADTIDIIFTLNTNSTALISSVATLSAGQIDFYLELQDASPLANVVQPSAT